MDSGIAVSAKRYRYTGKERDEETGLDSMGVRYYAGGLGRWTSSDPIGIGDGVNRFAYVSGNPVGLRDPGGTTAIGDFFSSSIKQATETAAKNARAIQAAKDAVLEVDTTAASVVNTVTAPHQFIAGSAVGFVGKAAEVSAAPAVLAYGLVTDTQGTADELAQGAIETYQQEGLLGFTPIPSLAENVSGIFTAESAFEAGLFHGRAGVDAVETAGIAVAGGELALEEVAKSAAVRGVLLEETAAAGVVARARALLGLSGASAAADLGEAAGDITYMSQNDAFAKNAAQRTDVDPGGVLDVVAHGSSTGIEINGRVVDAADAANAISGNRQFQGQPIRLLACNTGACSTGFAQQLADALGVNVTAPNKFIWASPGGKLSVSGATPVSGPGGTSVLRPNPNDPGAFVTFRPQ